MSSKLAPAQRKILEASVLQARTQANASLRSALKALESADFATAEQDTYEALTNLLEARGLGNAIADLSGQS